VREEGLGKQGTVCVWENKTKIGWCGRGCALRTAPNKHIFFYSTWDAAFFVAAACYQAVHNRHEAHCPKEGRA